MRPQLSVVFDWYVSPFFKLEGRVHSQLLANAFSESLGPLGFARILLLFEVLVAFRPTKFEDLKIHTWFLNTHEVGLIRVALLLYPPPSRPLGPLPDPYPHRS